MPLSSLIISIGAKVVSRPLALADIRRAATTMIEGEEMVP
jgi:hypothetical protein